MVKNSPTNVRDIRDTGSIPGSGRSPGGGHGNPLQYSCLENPTDTGDTGSIPGSGRSPGGVNGNPLQYSCLGNPMDRGGWQAAGHGVAKETQLSD